MNKGRDFEEIKKELAKELNTRFAGKGGGKPEMIQGTVTASEEMIRSYMESV